MIDIEYDKNEKTIYGKPPGISVTFWDKFPVKLSSVGLKNIIISEGDEINSYLINVNTNEMFGNSKTKTFADFFSKEINKKFSKLKSQNDKMTSERLKYDDIVNQGDQLYNEKKYKEAKIKYSEALNLFKNEYYPKKKIAEIELTLKEMEASEILLEQYNNLISKADALKLENKLESK